MLANKWFYEWQTVRFVFTADIPVCQQDCGGGNPWSSLISDYQVIIRTTYQEEPNDQEWPNWHRVFLTDWKA